MHRATTMADGEISAGKAVFVLDESLRPVDKVSSCAAGLEHLRQVWFAENVAKEVFWIAGDPAVALSD